MLNSFGERQQHLLKLLLENKAGMTADELARALGVSKAAVHQHLTALERDGYVMRHTLIKTGGRPGQRYTLSERGVHLFPKQYAWFSRLLLQQLIERLGRKETEALLYRLGQETAAALRARLQSRERDLRLQEVVGIMEEFGYQAKVVYSESGVAEIRAQNCVYHDLAKTHPEICSLDLGLLEGLLEEGVTQTECMARGGAACRFCPLGRVQSKKGQTDSS